MLYVHVPDQAERWLALFRAALPDIAVAGEADAVDDGQVEFVACWRPPEGLFARFPRLRAVFALGAGVDRLLGRPDLAPGVALIRLTDAGMARQMAEYVLHGLLRFQRRFDDYARQQQAGLWQPLPQRDASELRVTVLGLGAIGGQVARTLALLGYPVAGWSRSPREIDGVRCLHGSEALDGLLAETDALAMILPNTAETRGLIDARRLGLLPAGALVINAGRGEQLDLEALLDGLDGGRLGGAQLDVFETEPLPAGHRAWRQPHLHITPHVAAMTLPAPSAQQVAAALRAFVAGRPVAGMVDRVRAY
ncbi:2-hydroxyacid dehydrogenase [Chitinimonas koreensis]|uniref:2-hydroxyacid dehydrogenase n=1 Tax=Chitinimonas koreensis TaxID=356302 RepID=UPI0004276FE3|nr:glyoxylate/hydroxypyruvate reductase A [Chitinimonas koreensis]QNM97329.1 glyoxylate/hydroxypyruvate reductase A [Chitinimonas koreensis]